MKTSLFVSLALALAAYAPLSQGASPKIDETALTGMRKGQTTFDEIVRQFGRPNFGSKNWDGTRTAAYAYGEGGSPAALSALGAVIGASSGDTVVLYFNDKGVLTDYKTNQAPVRPAESPAAPAVRYTEPSFGGTKPSPAAASAVKPAEATSIAPVPASKPSAAQASKPEPRNDGLPRWLPSTSTRDERY